MFHSGRSDSNRRRPAWECAARCVSRCLRHTYARFWTSETGCTLITDSRGTRAVGGTRKWVTPEVTPPRGGDRPPLSLLSATYSHPAASTIAWKRHQDDRFELARMCATARVPSVDYSVAAASSRASTSTSLAGAFMASSAYNFFKPRKVLSVYGWFSGSLDSKIVRASSMTRSASG